jgi:hypothetical protein
MTESSSNTQDTSNKEKKQKRKQKSCILGIEIFIANNDAKKCCHLICTLGHVE